MNELELVSATCHHWHVASTEPKCNLSQICHVQLYNAQHEGVLVTS